ncbi:MAG: hypothetical protein ACI4AM_05545 [Muribaculaceae bacterium]
MTQLTINIEDASLIPQLKAILLTFKGVSIEPAPQKPTGLDESYRDLREGRVHHYNSAEEMFQALGI